MLLYISKGKANFICGTRESILSTSQIQLMIADIVTKTLLELGEFLSAVYILNTNPSVVIFSFHTSTGVNKIKSHSRTRIDEHTDRSPHPYPQKLFGFCLNQIPGIEEIEVSTSWCFQRCSGKSVALMK